MIKIEIYDDPIISKYTLSIKRAIISLLLYLFVMVFGASIIVIIMGGSPRFIQMHNETDSLISTLYTKNGIGLVEADEFYNSYYKDPSVDVYSFVTQNDEEDLNTISLEEDAPEFLKNYLLIASKGVYVGKQADTIDETFIKNIFTLDEYYNNYYRVYRIIPKYLIEDETKITEFFSYFNIDEPIYDYKSLESTSLNNYASSLINIILYSILIIGLVILAFNVIKADFLRLGSFGLAIKNASVGLLLVYAANILSNMITVIVSALFKERVVESANQMAIVEIISSNYAFLMIISVVLLGPIVEELIFRKAIFSFFNNKKVAIVISSLAFGLIHILGESSLKSMVISIFPYLIPGLILGYIYAKNDENVIVPIITHVMLNTISVLLMFLL